VKAQAEKTRLLQDTLTQVLDEIKFEILHFTNPTQAPKQEGSKGLNNRTMGMHAMVSRVG
jgi:hypothetical protein